MEKYGILLNAYEEAGSRKTGEEVKVGRKWREKKVEDAINVIGRQLTSGQVKEHWDQWDGLNLALF